jgi:hypothetical protein
MNTSGTIFYKTRALLCFNAPAIRAIAVAIPSTILLLTSFAKLIDASGVDSYFAESSPLISAFSNRQMLFVAAIIEMAVVGFVILRRARWQSAAAILWFCILTSIYKIAVNSLGYSIPCSCLGVISKKLKLSNFENERLTWLILAIMMICSLLDLLLFWSGSRSSHSCSIAKKLS